MNKLNLIILSFGLILFSNLASAESGCCSWHKGVDHCDSATGKIVCKDGWLSSCLCEPDSNNPKFVPSSQPTQPTQPTQQSQSEQ